MMEDILKKDNPVSDPTSHIPVNIQDGNKGSEYEVKTPTPEGLENEWKRWKCLVCGYVYEGAQELKACPKCGNNDPDKFEDAD